MTHMSQTSERGVRFRVRCYEAFHVRFSFSFSFLGNVYCVACCERLRLMLDCTLPSSGVLSAMERSLAREAGVGRRCGWEEGARDAPACPERPSVAASCLRRFCCWPRGGAAVFTCVGWWWMLSVCVYLDKVGKAFLQYI